MNSLQKRREEIIEFGRLGYERGLFTGTGGNISCRCPEGMLITRSGVSLRSMEPEDILLVDGEGRLLEGAEGFRPSIETGFHAAIYRARPEVSCVYHTHATYCTYWALRGEELPLPTSVSRILLGRTPLAGYAEPGTPELVEEILHALQAVPECKALLLAGHGAVALGAGAEEAYYTAELMEQSAQLAYLLEEKAPASPKPLEI
ncbi:MAG: class II aldolase/adducin family protein [Firmicutes bacterium]|nr:class II aldolase/adducin family protein [Bacillota bacterium]